MFFEIKQRLFFLQRDLANRIRYGKTAPRFGEQIFLRASDCNTFLISGLNRKDSGCVMDGNWDLSLSPITDHPKYRYCFSHWVDGLSWKEAGAYDFLMSKILESGNPVDECLTEQDVIERYDRLDRMFDQVSTTGRLYSQKEINPDNFRETGGVYVHVDRNNAPIFGGGGMHRFAVSKILNLPSIPAQLGVVHKNAINDWVTYKAIPE